MSVTVVVVDPASEADAALGFGSEPEVVEELVREGAVEALCFAVGLGPIRPGPAVHDAAFGEDFFERVGDEVRPVVGENFVDGHVVGPEPVLGSVPELHQGLGGLVVVGFDVGDARVVVDGDVKVGVAHRAAFAFGLCAVAAVDAPAASWGDLADLLDVEVHQLARFRALIAAYHPPGGPVDPRQPVQAVALRARADR